MILQLQPSNAIEPPAILKDHIENKKLSQTSIDELKNEITNNPTNIDAYNLLIKLQINSGLTKDAINTYLLLANIYENSNLHAQAKLCYANALKLDPESELLQNKANTVQGINLPAITYSYSAPEKKAEEKISRYEANRLNRIKNEEEMRARDKENLNNTSNQSKKIYYNTLSENQINQAQQNNDVIVHTSNGKTYVRSKPDKDKSNNYSTKGNTNPYTGKAGTQ